MYSLQDKTRSKTCIHALPRALQLQNLPPYRGGLRCCYVSYDFGPRLPTEVGSGAAMCPMASNPASLSRWVPVLPCALWLWTPSPCRGGLRCCHVSSGSGPHLPIEVGSDAAACPIAMDLASRPRRVPVLSHVSRFPKDRVPHIYKERSSWPTYAARLVCFQETCVCSQDA
jgi:hypothetical protein